MSITHWIYKNLGIVYHKDKLLISLFTLIFILLYIFKLTTIPPSVHGDEGETGLQAIQILKGNSGIIGVGWFDLPLLSFLPHAIFMLLLGNNILADRLGSVVFGILVLPFFYLLLKENFDKKLAIVSTLLLGTSHLWLAVSRVGITYTESAFFVVIVVYILLKSIKTNKILYFILAGALFGLGMYSNFAVRILPVLVIALFLHYFLKKYSAKIKIINLVFFLISAVIIFYPQGMYYLKNPDTLSSREKSINVFSETGKQWTNYTNMSNTEILITQITRTFNIFAGDNSTQYGYKSRLFDYASIFFLLIGSFYALTKIREFRYQFIFLWFLLSIMGQVLTTIPPPIFLPRFVTGLPVLYFLISLGFIVITKILLRKLKTFHAYGLLSSILLLIVCYNLYTYFIIYPKSILGDPNARSATKIANLINSQYRNYDIYFYTQPSLYADFGTLRFISPDTNRVNLKIPSSSDSIFKPSNGNKFIYIIYPGYEYLFDELKKTFPNGKVHAIRQNDGYAQFYVYAPN